LLTDEKRVASIKALTAAKVLKIEGKIFRSIVRDDHNALKHLFKKSLNTLKGNFSLWFVKQGLKSEIPANWRLTFILVLSVFPVVVVYNAIFAQILKNYNEILVTFFSCAITISVTSLYVIPAHMYLFDWWLFPIHRNSAIKILIDIGIMSLICALEIGFFFLILGI